MLGLIGEGTGIAAKVLKSMGTYDATERGPRSDPTILDLERASRGLIQSIQTVALFVTFVFFFKRAAIRRTARGTCFTRQNVLELLPYTVQYYYYTTMYTY